MAHRTDQPPEQPTPVTEDIDAPAPVLLDRAAAEYADAQTRRQQLSREDRVHGNQTGGAS